MTDAKSDAKSLSSITQIESYPDFKGITELLERLKNLSMIPKGSSSESFLREQKIKLVAEFADRLPGEIQGAMRSHLGLTEEQKVTSRAVQELSPNEREKLKAEIHVQMFRAFIAALRAKVPLAAQVMSQIQLDIDKSSAEVKRAKVGHLFKCIKESMSRWLEMGSMSTTMAFETLLSHVDDKDHNEKVESAMKDALIEYVVEQNILAFEDIIFEPEETKPKGCCQVTISAVLFVFMYFAHLFASFGVLILLMLGAVFLGLGQIFVLMALLFTCGMVPSVVTAYRSCGLLMTLALKFAQLTLLGIIRPPERRIMYTIWRFFCCSCCSPPPHSHTQLDEDRSPEEMMKATVSNLLDASPLVLGVLDIFRILRNNQVTAKAALGDDYYEWIKNQIMGYVRSFIASINVKKQFKVYTLAQEREREEELKRDVP